jgi:PKD repeat protein
MSTRRLSIPPGLISTALAFTAVLAFVPGPAWGQITVQKTRLDQAPLANAGGPYTAFVGDPLSLNGSASADPDGDAITFSWTYGDGSTGIGANPVHNYSAAGVFGVTLTVTDGTRYSVATTTTTVVEMLQARAFTSNKSIRLRSGTRRWCVDIEPVGHSFWDGMVDLTTLKMKSDGTGSVSEIRAVADKSAVMADRDWNGIPEIEATFLKDDLRLLFGKIHRTRAVTVTLEGTLFGGGVFRTQIDLSVTGSRGKKASVSPNPLNPEAVLTFHTEQAGAASVDLFDVKGRLVRRVLVQEDVPAGDHDVRIDGRNDNGEKLASGIYYFRVRASGDQTTGQLAIMK